MNLLRKRIDAGQISTPEELTAHYKSLLKKYHPDLNGPEVPRVDFDKLKQDYAAAYKHLLERSEAVAPPEPVQPVLATREAFLDEFRNLVARGFPVNRQAMAKNKAYALSTRHVAEYLEHRFADAGFFERADAEARALKRHHPKTHWYVMQIFWNIGDWRVTGFDYYRRIFVRHLDFIRENLQEAEMLTLYRLLEDLVNSAS